MPLGLRYKIVEWKDPADFSEIETMLGSGEYTHAVAVGGDGTVNRVARALVSKNTVMGILPFGSGNGLARSLSISMNIETALQQIIENHYMAMDTGIVNGVRFVCTSGVGFDAHIGTLFARSKRRGLRSYVAMVMKEMFSYSSHTYRLEINGREIERKAFLITVANAGQYGNDFYIAPKASVHDGRFHVVILKRFNILRAPGIFLNILFRRADRSASIETHVASAVRISRSDPGPIHIDGEPAAEGPTLEYLIEPASLRVIYGAAVE
jgi:diacylglycerol kinase (ATP)